MHLIKIHLSNLNFLDIKLFATDEVTIEEKKEPDKFIKKAINIFKSAKSEEEKKCYLEALKNAHKCFKIAK